MSASPIIPGLYFPPRSARASPARMELLDGRLTLHVDGEDSARTPTLASVSQALAHVPRKLNFEDGGAFEAPPDAPLEALGLGDSRVFGAVARAERSLVLVAGAALAILAVCFGLWRWGLPLMAQGAAAVTPAAILHPMDVGTLKSMEGQFLRPSKLDKDRQRALAAIFQRLAEVAEPRGAAPQLLFRDAPVLGPNAFALPGGSIVLTDALVRASRSDSEVAGVLAHELGHVELRHSLRQIYSALGVAVMITLLGGDPGALVDAVISQAGVLMTLSYSRAFESEADARAVELLLAIGENPVAFVDLLERLEASMGGGQTSILSTHPGAGDRREAVRALAAKARPRP